LADRFTGRDCLDSPALGVLISSRLVRGISQCAPIRFAQGRTVFRFPRIGNAAPLGSKIKVCLARYTP